TFLPRSLAQTSTGNQTYFGTYTDASALTLESVGGTLDFTNRSELIAGSAPSLQLFRFTDAAGDQPGLHLLPPTFAAVAFGGDLTVGRSVVLWPSRRGNLALLAAGSVQLNAAPILVSDVDAAASLPSANAVSIGGVQNLATVLTLLDPLTLPNALGPATPGLHA